MPKPETPALSGSNIITPPVSPQRRICLFDDDKWEEFVREWASTLAESYLQIKRFGGSGDRGSDVAIDLFYDEIQNGVDGQVIVLENIEPPNGLGPLAVGISFTRTGRKDATVCSHQQTSRVLT